MKIVQIILSLIMVSIINVVNADSLPIKPGMWEYTMTMTNSLTGTRTTKSKECIKEKEFDPGSMMGDENCKVTNSTLTGDTLNFSMACSMQGGQATMSGVYQTDGNTGSGSMNMEMSMGGQTMTMETTMTANRLSDC